MRQREGKIDSWKNISLTPCSYFYTLKTLYLENSGHLITPGEHLQYVQIHFCVYGIAIEDTLSFKLPTHSR